MGSVRLFNLCRGKKLEKLVYSSSSAMFGEAERIPVDESHPQAPESFYALSKMAGEHYALLAQSLWGVPAVCLRYFNVYGLPMEYNEYTGVISIFFDRLQENRCLTIFGDGEQYRDFVYVEDVVQANLRAATLGRVGEAYNIGSGSKTTIRELAEAMIELTGRDVAIEYEGFRAGEVRESLADIGRARSVLGFNPQEDIRSGLGKMWDGLRRKANQARERAG
jgi:UDP-glucose 4-epimerase